MLNLIIGNVFAATAMITCGAPVASAVPQPSPDPLMLQAVVREVETMLDPADVMLVDPELMPVPEGGKFPDHYGEGPVIGPGQIRIVLAGTRVGTGRHDDVVKCPSGPPSCYFVGADAFLRLSEVIRIDGRSTIRASLTRRTGVARQPLGTTEWRLTLEPSATGWLVTERVMVGTW